MLTWPFQSDAAVLRKVRAGDHASFRVIVDRYVHVIRGVALAYLSNSHDADDVVQDTFLRAFEAREKLTPPMNLGAWLVTVAKNRCFDLLRKRTRESGVPATTEPATTPAFDRDELYQVLWEHVSKLEPGTREVLMLHYFSRKSAREIATLLEITPDAAAKRLQRARTALGQRMVDQIGNELGVKTDRKRDTSMVMAVIAVQVPEFPMATTGGTALTTGGVLKFASILTASLLIGVAAFQLLHGKSIPKQSGTQMRVTAIDSTLAASAPSTAATTKTSVTPAPVVPGESLDRSRATSDAEGRITGIVVDMSGKPLAGANVAIKRIEWPDERDRKSYAQTTTSDANGRFSLDRFPLLGASTGYYGNYEVTATKENLFGVCSVDDKPWLFDQFIEVAAYERFSIAGLVRDEGGNPVPQAVVIPDCNSYDVPIAWRGRGGGSVQSDAQGNFLLTNLMRGVYELRVTAFGFAPFQGATVSAGSTDVDVVLESVGDATISGRVIDSTGNAVKDVPVTAYLPNDGRTQTVDLSGPDGAFSLRLREGTYVVRLSNSDWALVAPAPVVTVEASVPPRSINLAVARGATITGTATSASGVDHVFATKVDANGEGLSGRVHDDGTYAIRGLSSGTYTVTVGNGERFGKHELDIEIGQDYRIDFTPEPVWSVNGTVTDVNGSPLAGAQVLALSDKEISVTRSRRDYTSLYSAAITDERGEFTCTRFDGENVHVQAITKSGTTSIEGPFGPQDNRSIELVLTPASFVDGHIVPASEHSKRNAFLIAVPLTSRAGALFPNPNATGELIGMNALDSKLAGGFRTTAGLSGRFRFPNLPAGDYEIHAYTLGMTVAPNPQPLRITVDPAQPIRDLEVRLPNTGGGSIQGKLTLKSTPLRGQKIQILPAFEEIKTFAYWSTNTNEDGEYRIDGVQPGRHELSVIRHMATNGKKGLREIDYHFDISEGDVLTFDFDIAGGTSSLSGLVTGAGEPVAGATLFIRTDDGPEMTPEEIRAETDSRGRFAVDGIHPGKYRVQVLRYRDRGNPTDPFSQIFDVEIADQKQNIVEFQITAGDMSGTVKGIRNNEVTWVVLIPGAIADQEISFERFRELKALVAYDVEVEHKGSYRLTNVEAGTYTAFAVTYPVTADYDEDTFAGLRYSSEVVEISPAKTLILDFAFE